MTDPVECPIAILMDENGYWRVADLHADNVDAQASDLAEAGGTMMRRINLTVTVTPPVATELAIATPDEARTTAFVAVED